VNKPLGIALLVIGVILLVVGYNEGQSVASEFSRAFTGSPTDRSLWFLIGGGVAAALGLFFILSKPR
jgi:hypothetical protein